MIGKRLSHFRILAKIGEGGMGVVYRAEDERLRRQVALKVLPAELVTDEERRLRFLREARAAAAINHPNIATVHEVDEVDSVVFIAMELVEGKTLRELIGGRPMPIKQALRVAAEMAEGLAWAHQARVIHRDLKPENVILSTSGHVKILDFGLARLLAEQAEIDTSKLSSLETATVKLTSKGQILGTVDYMSPEQIRGGKIDARSDLFAFGVTLYEMATGKRPFPGKTDADTMSAIIRDDPIPPSQHNVEIPYELERMIGKCLEKDAHDRYQHADELAVDVRKLKRVSDSAGRTARTLSEALAVLPSSGWARMISRSSRRTVLVAGLAVLLIAGGVATWWGIRSAARFREGDRVLVGGFENKTGRHEFGVAIRDSFENILARSSFINVIRGEPLVELVKARGGGGVPDIDRDVAEELCGEGSCAGFLIGTIEPQGEGLEVGVALYRAGRSSPGIVRSAFAPSEKDVLKTIHGLALDLRRALGESSQSIASRSPPRTESVLAFQALAASAGLDYQHLEEMILLQKRALELDPEYYDPYYLLALNYGIIGDWKEYRRYAEEAYRRSSSLPEKDRMMAELLFLEATYDFETEIDRLTAYRRLYPFEATGHNYLGYVYLVYLQDPISAEEPLRATFELYSNDPVELALLSWSLEMQGKADEIEQLVEMARSQGGEEKFVAVSLLRAAAARGDWKGLLETLDRLETGEGLPESEPGIWRLRTYLKMGRLRQAEGLAPTVWRQTETGRRAGRLDRLHEIGLSQAWLEMRRRPGPGVLPPRLIELARNSLLRLPKVATYSVHAKLGEPLARLIEQHEEAEKDSKSRFVREELQFARGCLALARGEAEKARSLLEPITRNSLFQRRHHVLARTYEALGRWKEAAAEYERVLKNPHLWALFTPPVQVLDQYGLARIYERLGDTDRARHWYEQFLADWKDADPDISELIEARKRLAALGET